MVCERVTSDKAVWSGGSPAGTLVGTMGRPSTMSDLEPMNPMISSKLKTLGEQKEGGGDGGMHEGGMWGIWVVLIKWKKCVSVITRNGTVTRRARNMDTP